MNTSLIKKIQNAVNVKADGELGNITLNAIAEKLGIIRFDKNKLVEIAKGQLGIFETSKNHGQGISKYWTATNYPEGYSDRAPYCAAAVCWMVRQTGQFSEQERPKTALAFGFEGWARERGLTLQKPPQNVRKGDLVIFAFSHVGIAISDSDSDGNFQTVEANTSGTSSGDQRDGGGVFQKLLNLGSVRSVVRF